MTEKNILSVFTRVDLDRSIEHLVTALLTILWIENGLPGHGSSR